MRTILRAILSVALLLGSGISDWMPAASQVASLDPCCSGTPASTGDSCPCPKPENNRTPQRGACTERQAVVAQQAARRGDQGQRRTEPRPEPASWAVAQDVAVGECRNAQPSRGRDPDLGTHLARLSTFRI